MSLVHDKLAGIFCDAQFTKAITSAAYGKPKDAKPYANMLVKGHTDLPLCEISSLLKSLEKTMGDTPELRAEGIVMMDIDILEYGGIRYHQNDWNRPYIKKLLGLLLKSLIIASLFVLHTDCQAQPAKQNSELLGKAVEYYQNGKYHECIINFEKLKKSYVLTPRLTAWLGFSYYKEQKYEEAAENMGMVIPQLEILSPKERSIYIYVYAESLFYLQRYEEAIRYYEMVLPLTEGNDKGDVLFHTAFAHYLSKPDTPDTTETSKVHNILEQALSLYRENANTVTPQQRARMRQTEKMLKGLK